MDVIVGRIGRAHGLTGEVTVEVRTDDPDRRFAPGAELSTEPAARGPLRIAASRWANGRLLLRLAGVDDRTAAEELRNTMLLVSVDPLESPEDPEEFYDHQLIGCVAVTAEGAPVGEIREVLHLPGQDVLVVRRDEDEVLVPFVRAIVPTVDVAARRVVLTPPPGLLDEEAGEDGGGSEDTASAPAGTR